MSPQKGQVDNSKSTSHGEKDSLLQDVPHQVYSDAFKENSVDIATQTSIETSRWSRFVSCISSLTLEPFMFLIMFAYFSRSVCVTNLAIDKACRNYYNYSEDICRNLSSNLTIKAQVEAIANDYNLYINLIHMVPGAIVMVFLGPWSDRYGRKGPLLAATLGNLLDVTGVILNTIYFEAPLGYLLLSSTPSGLVGGFICVLCLLNSMASEVSTKRMRTIKFAFVELAFGSGMALGGLAGGLLYDTKYSYFAAFGVSAAANVLCVFWLLFFISETRGLMAKETWLTKIKDLFSLQNFKDGWRACTKVRENKGRLQIWLLFTSMCTIVITYESLSSIGYLYVYYIYSWGPATFSKVNTIFSMIGMVILIVCTPLFVRTFKMKDGALGLLGIVSMMAKNVLFGLAQNHVWVYYAGNALGAFGGLAILSVRSRLSKIVDENDLGKVFTFLSTCESLVPQIGNILITRVYNLSLSIFPGMAYMLAAVIMVPAAVTFLWISRYSENDYQPIKKGQIQAT